MKKILFALLALFCINTLSATNLTSTAEQGKRWTVKVTVKIIVKYYSSRYGSESSYLGAQDKGTIEQIVSVFAETEDEAESMAKDKCYRMCSDNSGEYQGTTNYGGQTAYMYLYRQILTARAE